MLPKLNDTVRCPEDRGDKPYTGKVTHVGQAVSHNHLKTPFVWTEVQHPSGSKHVWPSNRIGYTLTAEDVSSLAPSQAASPTPVAEPDKSVRRRARS